MYTVCTYMYTVYRGYYCDNYIEPETEHPQTLRGVGDPPEDFYVSVSDTTE